jgi:hypothetical protein
MHHKCYTTLRLHKLSTNAALILRYTDTTLTLLKAHNQAYERSSAWSSRVCGGTSWQACMKLC